MDRARCALAPGLLAVAALTLVTGCTATNPQTTQAFGNVIDAAQVDLGKVTADSLMVVAAGGDQPGTLVARLVNRTSDQQSVTITDSGPSGLDETFQVPPDAMLAVGPDQERSVTVDPVGAEPGANLTMTVAVEGGRTRRVTVPVIGDTLPEYATLVPTASTTPTEAPSTAPASTSTISSGTGRTSGAASSNPVVTAAPTDSPTGGASVSETPTPRRLSPSGTPTG